MATNRPDGESFREDNSGSYLFIGGVLDGQLIDIFGGKPEVYYHPVRVDDTYMRNEVYHREPIHHIGRMVAEIYREHGLRMEEIIIRLLAAYAENKR